MLREGALIIAAFVGLVIVVAGGLLLMVHLEAKRMSGGDRNG